MWPAAAAEAASGRRYHMQSFYHKDLPLKLFIRIQCAEKLRASFQFVYGLVLG